MFLSAIVNPLIDFHVLFLHSDGGENEELDDLMDDINIQDSSNEMSSSNTDQCPVCLMSLKEQLLGTPNNCPHVFCFECIQEWAKVCVRLASQQQLLRWLLHVLV